MIPLGPMVVPIIPPLATNSSMAFSSSGYGNSGVRKDVLILFLPLAVALRSTNQTAKFHSTPTPHQTACKYRAKPFPLASRSDNLLSLIRLSSGTSVHRMILPLKHLLWYAS
ncbi:hypothetical protein RDI58_006382 [Solanum bulbocastanum]|uniref:Uncharacterized protein n=1 Tax=Solanum bulbocastanum TaxID=147425 RepID=A0AAN8U4X9_SOLBU